MIDQFFWAESYHIRNENDELKCYEEKKTIGKIQQNKHVENRKKERREKEGENRKHEEI